MLRFSHSRGPMVQVWCENSSCCTCCACAPHLRGSVPCFLFGLVTTSCSHLIKLCQCCGVAISRKATNAMPGQSKVLIDKSHVEHLPATIGTNTGYMEQKPPNELARQGFHRSIFPVSRGVGLPLWILVGMFETLCRWRTHCMSRGSTRTKNLQLVLQQAWIWLSDGDVAYRGKQNTYQQLKACTEPTWKRGHQLKVCCHGVPSVHQ